MFEEKLERAVREFLDAVDHAADCNVLARAIAKIRRAVKIIDDERDDLAKRRAGREK